MLADDVVAPLSLPGFDNSAMDGYAVLATDVAAAGENTPVRLPVAEDIPAGRTDIPTLAAGTAILIATHDFAEAERLASRVAFLAQGRVVRAGRLAELLAQLRTGAPERELSLAGPASGPAEGVLRRAGFVPAEAGGLVWRSVERSGLDGAALLGALRAQNVPVA